MLGTLYIVATPIGNLRDITLRAIKTLNDMDIVLAEDTRVTRRLLDEYRLKNIVKDERRRSKNTGNEKFTSHLPKLITYHQHSTINKKNQILKYLVEGKDVALVTDAGTPGIQDPGNELIDFILNKEPNIKVVPIPGASSLTAALSVCGFNVNRFSFLGFLKKKKSKKLLNFVKENNLSPFVFFESPHRILKTLENIREIFGDKTRVFVGRELTKMHETIYRGSIKSVLRKIKTDKVKGEFVLIIESK